MSKKILLFATEREAFPTIQALQAKVISSFPSAYVFSKGWIVLSQMGLFASHHSVLTSLTHFGAEVDEMINLGFSAALGPEAKIGEIHAIGSVGKQTLLPEGLDQGSAEIYHRLFPRLEIASTGKKLLSSEFPIHDGKLKEELRGQWDLVDMEGYGIAYGALKMQKKVSMFKITSDFALPGGRDLISRHQNELAQTLATFVLQLLKK